MAINAVVAGVQLALEKPRIVAFLEAAGMDSLEVALPREQFAREFAPEAFWVCNRLLVQLLVFFEVLEMRLRVWVLAADSISCWRRGIFFTLNVETRRNRGGGIAWVGGVTPPCRDRWRAGRRRAVMFSGDDAMDQINYTLTRKRPWGRGMCRRRAPRPRWAHWSA